MKIYLPVFEDGKWSVEISLYPESRSIEEYRFDTEDAAKVFYDLNRERYNG